MRNKKCEVVLVEKELYQRPKKRSKLRLYIGKKYYTLKRYGDWYFHRKGYSKSISQNILQFTIFSHKSLLLRKLQGVDLNLQFNKITNLKIATQKINGVCIKPGETLSYWRHIGKPTRIKGYKDGLVLNPDGTFGKGVGGGLCQLSNLIYWMTLHTPMRVIERHRHSHDIFPDSNRTQPFGSGATCVYNYMDLQIYNVTDIEYQLIVFLTEDYLVGEWRCKAPHKYSYQVYEKEHYISSTFWGGYVRNNIINRRIFENGEFIKDEFVTENHALMMYQPLLAESSI